MTKPNRRSPIANQLGFSMVELAVVVSVFSLAFIAALPAFQTSLRGHRLQSSANKIETQLRLTRSRAVAENTPFIVAWFPDAEEYFVVRDENWDDTPDWGTEQVDGPILLPQGIDVSYVNAGDFPDDQIVFNPNGSTSLSGQLVLEDDKERKIYIEILQPSGVIHVLSEDEFAAGN